MATLELNRKSGKVPLLALSQWAQGFTMNVSFKDLGLFLAIASALVGAVTAHVDSRNRADFTQELLKMHVTEANEGKKALQEKMGQMESKIDTTHIMAIRTDRDVNQIVNAINELKTAVEKRTLVVTARPSNP